MVITIPLYDGSSTKEARSPLSEFTSVKTMTEIQSPVCGFPTSYGIHKLASNEHPKKTSSEGWGIL